MTGRLLPLVAAALLAAMPVRAPVRAQTLRIATSAETSSADPHHYAAAPNSTLRGHLFDGLTRVDRELRVAPALAESWERRDELTWTFRLRRGVTFSDGARFGAPDVVFSLCRILNNKEELVSSYSSVVRRLDTVVAEGEEGLVIRTRVPEPLLLSDLAALAVLPRSLGRADPGFDREAACGGTEKAWPALGEFNAARAAVGTGPYRLVSYMPRGAIVLARNDAYWGPRPPWAEVRLLPITQAASRTASLLAGDQDLIEAPATADLPRLRGDGRFAITASPTTRLVFLQLDTARDPSPFVTAGGRNPLRDPRVRQALSLALNRKALVDRIMDGVATPAAQFLPDGMRGTVPGLPVLPYDPARARALLAEAGYPDGFALTLHATNNRYVNDGSLAQAVVQQWQRVGVRAELDAMPSNVFFPRRGRREFSAAMGGWSTDADETLGFFRTWIVSTDADAGLGTSNYGGWSDAPFDRAVRAALVQMDDAARAALLREAGQRALAEMPVVPLHFESAVWASRKDILYPGRVDQTTLATEATPR